MRFANNCRYKDKRLNGPLLSSELQESQLSLVKQSQMKSFSIELEALNRNKKMVKGMLAPLNPFLDNRGLIRVVGRLGNSQFNREKKHPVVLLVIIVLVLDNFYNFFRFFDKVYDFLLKSAGNLKNVVPYPKVVD